jgi:hypothetical protein
MGQLVKQISVDPAQGESFGLAVPTSQGNDVKTLLSRRWM